MVVTQSRKKIIVISDLEVIYPSLPARIGNPIPLSTAEAGGSNPPYKNDGTNVIPGM